MTGSTLWTAFDSGSSSRGAKSGTPVGHRALVGIERIALLALASVVAACGRYPAWLREQEEKMEQAAAKSTVEALEWEWLEASEELEKAT